MPLVDLEGEWVVEWTWRATKEPGGRVVRLWLFRVAHVRGASHYHLVYPSGRDGVMGTIYTEELVGFVERYPKGKHYVKMMEDQYDALSRFFSVPDLFQFQP